MITCVYYELKILTDSILTGTKTVPPLSATVSRRESKSNFLAEGPNSVRDPNENGLRHGQ
jgi:hypothetical protein